MSIIKPVRGFTPKFGDNCFFADGSVIVGDVIAGDDCSFWFNCVVRGDVNSIRLGNKVNVQDGAILHTLYKKSTVVTGNNVSIGHNAVVHGAEISDNVLVGIGATVLDFVKIGENSIVAAGALVKTGTEIEPNSIYAGVPAVKIKDIDPEQTRNMIDRIANNYTMYADWFREK